MRLEWTTDTALALHAVLCIIKRLMFIRDRTFRTAVAILLRTTFPFGKPRTMLSPLTIVAVYCYFISGTFRTECFYTIRSTNWNNQFTFLVMHIYIYTQHLQNNSDGTKLHVGLWCIINPGGSLYFKFVFFLWKIGSVRIKWHLNKFKSREFMDGGNYNESPL